MGPDTAFQNTEVCFGSNEDHLGIVSVQDKASPVEISRATYPNLEFVHQGWLTDDHRFFVLNDEADETARGLNTQTVVFDVSDLANPGLPLLPCRYHDRNRPQSVYSSATACFRRTTVPVCRFSSSATSPPIHWCSRRSSTRSRNPMLPEPTVPGACIRFFTSGVLAVSDTEQGLFLLRESTP